MHHRLMLPRWFPTWPLLALALLPEACSCEVPKPCVPPQPGDEAAAVEVGTGFAEFTPLNDGDYVAYVRGIQGGTHIDGALRIHGLTFDPASWNAADLPVVDLRLLDGEAEVGGLTMEPRAFSTTADDDRVGEVLGVQAPFFEDASVHIGKTLALLARAAPGQRTPRAAPQGATARWPRSRRAPSARPSPG